MAIAGSLEPARAEKLGLRNLERAAAACAALGRALATQGVNITVYSSDPQFVEVDIVRGYVAAAATDSPRGSIRICAPLKKQDDLFPELDTRPELFDVQPDPSDDWEVAYYRSLRESDGVLLVGGGRSTQITGLIALSFHIPVVAVATFGGYAERVWRILDRVQPDAEREEINRMVLPWRDDLAEPLVASLLAQHRRRVAREQAARHDARRDARRSAIGLILALVLLVGALTTIPLSHSWQPGTVPMYGLIVAAPVLAAATGALIRNATDRGREWLRTAALGTVAGAIAGLLFVAAQLLTTPDVLASADAGRLLFFLLPVGLIGGFTFDDVYRKLRAEDVTRTDVLRG